MNDPLYPETAQKLRDAGFPQESGAVWVRIKEKRIKNQKTGEWYVRQERWAYRPYVALPEHGLTKALEWASCPTLSLLVVMLGKDFIALVRNGVFYYADGGSPDMPIRAEGSTPREAVAALWLATNKKL